MKKHWKFSKHFAERMVERGPHEWRPLLKKIKAEFDSTVLVKIFDCIVKGSKQRVMVDGFQVCYIWDESDRELIVTTIYKSSL